MNKRIRKKKHVGEFTELGFQLHATLRPNLGSDEVEAVMDRLLELIEARHLEFGGSLGQALSGFVTRAEGGSATEADRTALGTLLQGDPSVAEHTLDELRDIDQD